MANPLRFRLDGEGPLREFDTVFGGVDAALDVSPRAPGGSPGAGGVADVDEFWRALVEIGLISDRELQSFAASCSEGVLGLSRALARASKLTPYQAAAVYQRKSRGLLIGKYIILDKLGQRGMGTVFLARHRLLGQAGALKILPPSFGRDRAAVMQFRREIEAAGRLKHPNVVAAFDAGEDRGTHFLVMDYVEGRDLDHVIRERGPMPVDQAIDCLTQAARGLEAAHAQGIVHRDIKPANLMLDSAGTVRVLDLGLAHIALAANPFGQAAGGLLTESGKSMRSVDYMAPEQAKDWRRADERADIYSLGCTLHYLLTGRNPFEGETDLKRLTAHMERPAPTLRAARPDVSPKLEAVFQKMMAKRPDERPGSMTEVIALLESCKAQAGEVTAAGDPAKTRAERRVFDEEPLERAAATESELEPSLFVRRREPEGLRINHELSLEDLVMDVRPDVLRYPLPRAPKPAMARSDPLQRRRPTSSASRPRRITIVLFALGAVAVVGAALVGFVWLPARNETDVGGLPDRALASTETSPITKKTSDRAVWLVQVPPASRTHREVKTIFDGTSGQSWMLLNRKPLPRTHVQADGLNPHGTGSYLVVYEQKLADFVLDFDYKLTKGCNSGVFLRVCDLSNPINTGLEVALDDTSGTGMHDPGALDDLVAPKVQAQLPAGRWNHMTITADGPRISVTLNGTNVSAIDLDEWTRPGKRPDGSIHKYKNVAVANLARSGYIGFQDHGRDCWFKNVVVNSPSTSTVSVPSATGVAGP